MKTHYARCQRESSSPSLPARHQRDGPRAGSTLLDSLERPVEESGQQCDHHRTGNNLVVAPLGNAIEE